MLKQLGTETHRYETVGLGSLVSYAQYLYGAKIAKQSDAGLWYKTQLHPEPELISAGTG